MAVESLHVERKREDRSKRVAALVSRCWSPCGAVKGLLAERSRSARDRVVYSRVRYARVSGREETSNLVSLQVAPIRAPIAPHRKGLQKPLFRRLRTTSSIAKPSSISLTPSFHSYSPTNDRCLCLCPQVQLPLHCSRFDEYPFHEDLRLETPTS